MNLMSGFCSKRSMLSHPYAQCIADKSPLLITILQQLCQQLCQLAA